MNFDLAARSRGSHKLNTKFQPQWTSVPNRKLADEHQSLPTSGRRPDGED